MRRHTWLLLAVAAAGAGIPSLVGAYEPPQPTHRYRGKLVAGEWSLDFRATDLARILVAKRPVTGFAFGPGRAEVAYCGPVEPQPGSGLWVKSVPDRLTLSRDRGPGRLVWAAPEGATQKGPIWWAPDGSKIAVRACVDEGSDLVVVDYVSGEPGWVTRGAEVVAAAWAPRGRYLAYVIEAAPGRAIWVADVPSGESRRVGEGGLHLHWSLDGKRLMWLRRDSESAWTEMAWEASAGQVTARNVLPARPEGTLWSPDGRRCAAIEPVRDGEERQLVIYPAGSEAGEVVPLPGLGLKRLLSWSPDGRVLLVLGDENVPFAVSAPSHDEDLQSALAGSQGLYSKERVATAGVPVDPDAGLPSWSSGGDMLVYVLGKQVYDGYGMRYDEDVSGYLGVHYVEREHVGSSSEVAAKVERDQVLRNMKNLALALQMYATEWDGCLPPSNEVTQLKDILADYLYAPDVFMRPGSEDEVAVRFLVDPSVSLSEFEDPFETEVAIVDYHPDFYVVAYADGHVETFDKVEQSPE